MTMPRGSSPIMPRAASAQKPYDPPNFHSNTNINARRASKYYGCDDACSNMDHHQLWKQLVSKVSISDNGEYMIADDVRNMFRACFAGFDNCADPRKASPILDLSMIGLESLGLPIDNADHVNRAFFCNYNILDGLVRCARIHDRNILSWSMNSQGKGCDVPPHKYSLLRGLEAAVDSHTLQELKKKYENMRLHDINLEHGYQTFIHGQFGTGKSALLNWLFLVAALNKTPVLIYNHRRCSYFHASGTITSDRHAAMSSDWPQTTYKSEYWEKLPILLHDETSYRRMKAPPVLPGSSFVAIHDQFYMLRPSHGDPTSTDACHFVHMPHLNESQLRDWSRYRGANASMRDYSYYAGGIYMSELMRHEGKAFSEYEYRRLDALLYAANADKVDIYETFLSKDDIAAGARLPTAEYPVVAEAIETDAKFMLSRLFALTSETAALGDVTLALCSADERDSDFRNSVKTAVSSVSVQMYMIQGHYKCRYNGDVATAPGITLVPEHPDARELYRYPRTVNLNYFGYPSVTQSDAAHPNTTAIDPTIHTSAVNASINSLHTIQHVLQALVRRQAAAVDLALSHALTDAAVQQEMEHVIAVVDPTTTASLESVRSFFAAPHKQPQYTAIITSNPATYPTLTSLFHQFAALGRAKNALHTSVDLLDAADTLSEDLSACADIGSIAALKELYVRKMIRRSVFVRSNLVGSVSNGSSALIGDYSNYEISYKIPCATNEVMNMVTIDTTMATTIHGNVDLTFTSDAAALVFMFQNHTLETDEEIEARMIHVARKLLFRPENVRWDGVLGVLAKTMGILRRYSLLDIGPTLFQVNDSFDHSTAILGGRYFPPVAVETLDYIFHGTAEMQLNACLVSVGVFIREHKRELVKRQGPTFLRFPRDIACFDGCSVVPPASLNTLDASFQVVLSLRVYKDVAEAAARPHASVSHEAAITAWRAEAAAASSQDVRVSATGAYQFKRYSCHPNGDMEAALAGLQNMQTYSDIASVPVDTVIMNTYDAIYRMQETCGECFGSSSWFF